MATFKCARCNYPRESATDECAKCGWTPKKASYEAAAADARAGVIDEVATAAAARRQRRHLSIAAVVGAAILFGSHWLNQEALGGVCEDDSDCRGRLFCLHMSPGPNLCSERCGGDASCDDGWVCVSAVERTTNRYYLTHESSALVCVPASAAPPPPEPEPEPEDEPEAQAVPE